VLFESGGVSCEFAWSLDPGVHPMREPNVNVSQTRVTASLIEALRC
jgi:hypothetical protein